MADAPHFAPIEVYLTVNGGLKAIEFYKKAFGAKTAFHQMADDGKRVLHSTLNVFGACIMLSDHFAEHSTDTAPPDKIGGASVTVHVNLDKPAKVNAAMAKAAKGWLHHHHEGPGHLLGHALRPTEGPLRPCLVVRCAAAGKEGAACIA